MFGLSWGEIGLIMTVALIAIGPKDLPVAIRTVTGLIKKARSMAAEFQGHVDEMMREANLSDVKGEIDKLRRFDFRTAAESTLDPDGKLRAMVRDVNESVVAPSYISPSPVEEPPADAPAVIPPEVTRKAPVPAFIPPGTRHWGF
ncbi:Sec-independent protein translocase protein TatB [Acidocella sp.]|uniref:Sec-independent protein translocase protein TatB n=1 Tax=Acidocella sp. TaxID=50710 RepID=UPI00263297BF|nr:Sec-independent protein translocase protein TatB [Acidocella sp.]